jgi:5-methylcytosine-specific restriction endonuclease McrA
MRNTENIIGKTINCWLIIKINGFMKVNDKSRVNGRSVKKYYCKCINCDKTRDLVINQLLGTKQLICKCVKYSNIVGKKINNWTVTKFIESIKQPKGSLSKYYFCKCICGNERKFSYNYINSDKFPISCGCHVFDIIAGKLTSPTRKKDIRYKKILWERYPSKEEEEIYKNWRKAIIERDNNICYICNKKAKKVQIHHILNWKDNPELRYDINNGVCLCGNKDGCHDLFHKRYTKKNNNRIQLDQFRKDFQSIVNEKTPTHET